MGTQTSTCKAAKPLAGQQHTVGDGCVQQSTSPAKRHIHVVYLRADPAIPPTSRARCPAGARPSQPAPPHSGKQVRGGSAYQRCTVSNFSAISAALAVLLSTCQGQ